jgi:CRP/FNR family transcriptional regulator, polysaccharide utilization system transcription regulator
LLSLNGGIPPAMDEQLPDNDLIIPLQRWLTPEEVEEIRTNSSVAVHQRRDLIFRQNSRTSHILFVKSGLVKVFKEDKNRRSYILKIVTPGEFLGILSYYGNTLHQFSAAAIDTCEIGYIDFQTFNRVLRNNGMFAMEIIRTLSQEGLYMFEKLLRQSHKQLPGRIADVILYFSETIHQNEEFDFPLTRRELAELAGTTKESFIRTLAEFKNDKIIDLEGSHVKINSMKIVRTLSELG